ncbi:MAG TPA: hypothetical protein VG167_17785 [Verrucomicrobiae bacterium]|nr:hypothetical protein [Verrucomicrobiae bacterium]
MSRFAISAALGLLILAGCGKPSQGASPLGQAADSVGAPPSPRGLGAVPEPAGTVTITNAENQAATLQDLSGALREYVIRTRSVPKNFDEFASKTQLQAPLPPAGKKYAIRDQAVVLVNK